METNRYTTFWAGQCEARESCHPLPFISGSAVVLLCALMTMLYIAHFRAVHSPHIVFSPVFLLLSAAVFSQFPFRCTDTRSRQSHSSCLATLVHREKFSHNMVAEQCFFG